MSVKIFTITHKSFIPPRDSMYVPLHVGCVNAEDLGFIGDDVGDSISHLNPNFCELTGMYWLWKNYHEVDYIGICHYRRYLINESGSIFTKPQLYPEYFVTFQKLVHEPHTYFGNIFITSKEMYDRYCTWLFDILFEVQKAYRLNRI